MGLIVFRNKDRGKPPKWICSVCKSLGELTVFAEDEHSKFERHVIACAKRHEEHLRSLSMRSRHPALFDPKVSGDVELNAWVRREAEAILHGRKKM
jgi:hypothetical protein